MSSVPTPNARAMNTNTRIGKYRLRYSKRSSEPAIGSNLNRLEDL
jgi:hypothetical protein